MKTAFLLLFLWVILPLKSPAENPCTPEVFAPDFLFDLNRLVLNGRILSVKPIDESRTNSLKRFEAEVQPLKFHKEADQGKTRPVLPVIFSVVTDSLGKPRDTAHLPLPQPGQRYCLFLVDGHEDGKRIYMPAIFSRTSASFSALLLSDDQPDDAPLLLEKDATRIAIEELQKHRPELIAPKAYAAFIHRQWAVTLTAPETPDYPEAQIFINPAGKITSNTWIAAESLRKLPDLTETSLAHDLNVPVLLLDHDTPKQITISSIAPAVIAWGEISSSDSSNATHLHGLFHQTTSAHYRDRHFPKERLLGIQRLAVVPDGKRPPPLPFIPGP